MKGNNTNTLRQHLSYLNDNTIVRLAHNQLIEVEFDCWGYLSFFRGEKKEIPKIYLDYLVIKNFISFFWNEEVFVIIPPSNEK